MRALAVAVAFLVFAVPAAAGGGWATAGLAPPEGIKAGQTWDAEITVLQHGQTPLEGVKPAVVIRNDRGVEKRYFAEKTGKPGVYVAEVKFPTSGTWRYLVEDGFGGVHGFAPVQVAPGGGGTSLPIWPFALAGAFALLAAVILVGRRLRPIAAPAAHRADGRARLARRPPVDFPLRTQITRYGDIRSRRFDEG